MCRKTSDPAFCGHIRCAVGGCQIFEDLCLDGRIRQVVGLHLDDDIRTTVRQRYREMGTVDLIAVGQDRDQVPARRKIFHRKIALVALGQDRAVVRPASY